MRTLVLTMENRLTGETIYVIRPLRGTENLSEVRKAAIKEHRDYRYVKSTVKR